MYRARGPAPGLAPVGPVLVEAKPEPARPEVVVVSRPEPARPPAPGMGSAMDDLRARYERDAPHSKFITAHTSIVWGEGDPKARLMFIGEAPGAEEDRCGRPFVGRSGQLLEKMIAAMGLSRERVYIANVLKTRPPDNATPTSEEVRLCAPYLFEQIGIVGPEVIVTLGLPAARALLNTTDSMSHLRGRWASFSPPSPYARAIGVMPTYHPAFLLRSYTAENRAKVWSDLRLAMERLGLKPASGNAPG
ncbi:MAG: uracil-DNA glycosylase [Phycisphaerales bacterium]|nr:uracil-DNA glycosylase [Phycisphaerales bacterium]